MKINQFTYTKASGDISKRTIIELVTPNTHVEGIDISGLDTSSQIALVKELNELETEISSMRLKMYQKYLVSDKYRRFTPERMSASVTQYV
jgi:hypothetical protein